MAWLALSETTRYPLRTISQWEAAEQVLQNCDSLSVVVIDCNEQEVWNPYYPAVHGLQHDPLNSRDGPWPINCVTLPPVEDSFPLCVKVANPRRQWPAAPNTVQVDATGLGGRDLQPPKNTETFLLRSIYMYIYMCIYV